MKQVLGLLARRSLIFRRVKQILLTAIVVTIVVWLARRDWPPRWSYGLAFAVAAAGAIYLAVHEFRYMTEHFGIRLLPPGWGSLQPRSAQGEGRFLSISELLVKFRWERGGIMLGRLIPQHRPFGLFKRHWIGPKEDRHMLTVAGTRVGKGAAALIPNLLLYPGSALVIDPKGELAQITGARRGFGSQRVRRCLQQKVFVLDPEDQVPNAVKARWNPLAELDPADPDLVARVQKITYALVPPEPMAHDQFFINQARDLMTMLTLHVMSSEAPDRHNLIHVRRLLAQGDTELFQMIVDECNLQGTAVPYANAMEALLHYMSESTAHGGKIAGFARRLVAMPPDTRNTVISDLYSRTSFLDQAGLEHMLQASDFSLADLKRQPMTVYVCLRGTSLATTMRPIAYILVDMAIMALEAVQEKPPHAVLFAMDEFYMLGRHESIDRAMGLIAGFDVKLWPIVQSIDQLKQHYPATWDNFIRNCGAVQFAGDQSSDVIQDLERRVGFITRKLAGGRSDRQPLLSFHELATNYFSRESRRQLVFFQQQPAAPLEFIDYYAEPSLNVLAETKAVVQSAASNTAWANQGKSIRLP